MKKYMERQLSSAKNINPEDLKGLKGMFQELGGLALITAGLVLENDRNATWEGRYILGSGVVIYGLKKAVDGGRDWINSYRNRTASAGEIEK